MKKYKFALKNPSPGTSRNRIYWQTKRGVRPPAKELKCLDCNKKAFEYDHYAGYGKNWDKVEPVCQSCHVKREFKRGARSRGIGRKKSEITKEKIRLWRTGTKFINGTWVKP